MPVIPLFIFAGQSNMVGPAMGGPPAIPDVRYWLAGDPALAFRTGPEHGFLNAVRPSIAGEIAAVKVALGGTSIRPLEGMDWSPQSAGELYALLLSTVAQAVSAIEAEGNTADIRGVLWMQGEAEYGSMANIIAFPANMADFIARIRSDLGIPDLPFVMGEVLHNPLKPIHSDALRDAQHTVAAQNPNTFLVETAGFEGRDGINHFAESGYFRLGDGYASFLPPIPGDVSHPHAYGTASDDTMTGTGYIFAAAGNDTIRGTGALFGGTGDDVLYGSYQADFVNGGHQPDKLYGEAGADRFYGSDGDDMLTGGPGADHLDGGGGIDMARYAGSTTVNVNLDRGTGIAGDAEGDVLLNVEDLYGSQYRDILAGDNDINELFGSGGNDTLYGFASTDRLIGSDGDDALYGGRGSDNLWGGQGSDTFVFRPDDFVSSSVSIDTIRDFEAGDRIVIHGFTTADMTIEVDEIHLPNAIVRVIGAGFGQAIEFV